MYAEHTLKSLKHIIMSKETKGANAQESTTVQAAVAKTVSLPVLDAKVSKFGELTLICRPTANNPSGAYVMRGGQTPSVLRNAGVPNVNALIALIRTGGSKLTFRVEECKEGQPFTDKATGEVKLYTKNWTKEFGHEVVLSDAIKTRIADKAIDSMFASNVSVQEPVYSAPVAKQAVAEDDSEAIADPNLG